jgi:hypothetical protein
MNIKLFLFTFLSFHFLNWKTSAQSLDYQFNGKVKSVEISSDNKILDIQSNIFKEYNPKRMLTKYKSMDNNGNIKYEKSFQYNENDQMIWMKYQFYSVETSTSLMLEDAKYSYNSKGQLIKQENFKQYNNTQNFNNYREWKYNTQGQKIEVNSFYKDGTLISKTEFQYDLKGNVTSEFKYLNNGTLLNSYEYEYNEKNQRTILIEYSSSGIKVQDKKYIYDKYGNISTEFSFGEISGKYIYKYDDKGNWIEMIEMNSKNEVAEKTTRTFIYYP